MQNVLPVDSFVVVNKTLIEDNKKVLINLYQPLIGSQAISLYYTLINYLDTFLCVSDELTHHSILNTMLISINEFNDARIKLESIGLIKTFCKTGKINNFVYEIYSPVTALEFFQNPVFSISLLNAIGEVDYNRVIELFKVPKIELKNYTNITARFKDTFSFLPSDNHEYQIENLKHRNSNSIEINTIDVDILLSLFPDEMLNIKKITKKDKELLNKIAYIYNYNIEQMTELIRNSLTVDHDIDYNLLKINANKYYEFDNEGKLPSLMFKKQPDALCSNDSKLTSRNKIIHIFENTSPYDFIASKYKTGTPTKSDLNIISYLLIDLEFNPGVVNVLIDYILKINNNKLNKTFVDVVASQWKKSNIVTVKEAMEIAEAEYHQRNSKRKIKEVKNLNEKKPKWLEKDIQSMEASKEEIEELERLLGEV